MNESRRIVSVDVVRGIAVVLMAVDHVRVYAGVPPGGPEPEIFFTRWITHFVAPAFALLAGTSAFLYGQRVNDARKLSAWLATRGLLLVILELTVIRLAWTFNTDFGSSMAGVIWMLGICMILLAVIVRLPISVIAAVGIVIIAGHNLMDYVPGGAVQSLTDGSVGWLWRILYFGGTIGGGDAPMVFILYSIVPWIGVMSAGYALGSAMLWPEEKRRGFLLMAGIAMIAAFLILRAIDGHGDPRSRADLASSLPAVLAFLATTKYPASLQFLLMTLGPALVLLAFADRARSRAASALGVFGSVPFFYYILHIPLIHALACVVSLIRTGAVNPWLFMNHPAMVPPPPEGYTWPLWLLYLVTAIAIAILYPLCRWYSGFKREHRHPLLSYI